MVRNLDKILDDVDVLEGISVRKYFKGVLFEAFFRGEVNSIIYKDIYIALIKNGIVKGAVDIDDIIYIDKKEAEKIIELIIERIFE